MYITNRPEVARIAEEAGVERIFVDMEYIGKSDRQGGMDTVQSRHTTADVALLRSTLTRAELLVRCNPIHEATEAYGSSEDELNAIRELNRKGQFYWDFVFVENSEGAHNSRLTTECLDKAEGFINEALGLIK
jgi:formate-dependent nitrite reductase cytochrome c552 subunit